MSIQEQLEDLQSPDDEEEGIKLDPGDEAPLGGIMDLCLVGRFLTDHLINLNAMSTRLSEVWRPVKGVHVKKIPNNRVLF
ncbi:hypothetical protein PTKIN_Ptkin16aG0102700 [Pterospermum kingtungense]